MEKKKQNQPEQIITELIIPKEEFKTVLNERIQLGEEILNTNIQTNFDLANIEREYFSWSDYNSEYLKQSFSNPNNEYRKTYSNAGYSPFGSLYGSKNNPALERKELLQKKIDNLKQLLAKTDLLKSSNEAYPKKSLHNLKPTQQIIKNEIFIVHGHDESAKIKTARFIEKLGFKPIILHELASSGKTIIEKIEEHSNVGFGIILYTPCDIGSATNDKENLKNRARQNVVFEHGYLIGKIGRSNVCALVKGSIEIPNDISGVVFVSMDEGDAWHLKMAKELRNSGYEIDMNKVI